MSTSDASRVADVETVQTALHGTLLEPPPGWPELNLVGTDGREFSLADRPADEVTVVFFGYTRCPDVCPTTMADLAVARQQLPNAVREHVTVVFVSEDPERDAPQVLRQWLDQFDTTFIGLLGGNEETRSVLAELHLTESTQIPRPDGPVVDPDTVTARMTLATTRSSTPASSTHSDQGMPQSSIQAASLPGTSS